MTAQYVIVHLLGFKETRFVKPYTRFE